MAETFKTNPLSGLLSGLLSGAGPLAGPGAALAQRAGAAVGRWSLTVAVLAGALILVVARLGIWSVSSPGPHRPAAATAPAVTPPAADQAAGLPAVEPQTFEQLSIEEAEARNAARPLSGRPLEPARPFVMPTTLASPLEWNRAVNCLALANYYEAASEGPAGMRAVSQVVLNRVRHPIFPKSVCEVVFQGSERPTGCQFTFTCDGSLTRAPVPALFERARAIAIAALHGTVERSVGMATHYHTRQVVPYWADSLDKIRVLGAHIFYVWHGGAGSRSAFLGQYAGESSAVADGYLPPEQRTGQMAGQPALAQQDFQHSARQVGPVAGGSTAKRAYLVADEQPKGLRADDEGAGRIEAQPLLSLSAGHLAADGR